MNAGIRRRQVVIGIDAMEWNLVQQWSEAGKLPTFRRLLESGSRAELSTTAAQLPDTVWAAIYSGTNPAKFRKYFYVQYNPETRDLRFVSDDEVYAKPYWEHLSAAGLRVGVVDVPKFTLSRLDGGFQITNWGAHATKTDRASYPASLLDEINKEMPPHPVGDCDEVDPKPKNLVELRRRIVEGVRAHGRLFRYLLRTRPTDVFFGGFSECHCVGHQYWHYLDAGHPQHPKEDIWGLGDSIEQVYRAIDAELGEILQAAGENAQMMVVSGHGMGPLYHASWNLPQILDLLGYGRENGHAKNGTARGRKARVSPWRVLKMTIPGPVQYKIKAALPERAQHELLFRWYAGNRDWKGRKAFAVPNNDSVGAIRISVSGRDAGGMVESGSEYDEICRRITEALYELRDRPDGQKVVKRVTLTRDEFSGPYLSNLPDLTVLWDNSFPWNTLYSPQFGFLEIPRQDSRTGSHSAHGFLIAAGPGIPAGHRLPDASVYDVAPTILETANVAIPSNMDGRPLPLHTLAHA